MKNTPTATIEDYLGIIYTLERDGEEVIGARLAEILQVSPPTVTVTLKRMVRDGWIQIDERKHICLTPAGSDAAKSVIRRHMLTEWLLSRVLHIPLSDLHDEAHRIEHSISQQVEEQMASSMDDPEVCPHGNPLPGQEDVAQKWLPFTAFQPGEKIIIRRIHELIEEDYDLMAYLAKHGVAPGVTAQVLNIDSRKNTFGIRIAENMFQVSYDTAEKLFADKA